MNKKKLITMLTALALVGAIGVGATLAYLSDSTKELKNTFKFTEEGIDIGLDEATIGDDNKAIDHDKDRVDASEAENGQMYSNIIPGMVLDKDPTVTVKAGSLDCKVFVSVKNANEENVLKINDLDISAWKELKEEDVLDTYGFNFTAEDDTKYYVYVAEKVDDSFAIISASKTDDIVLKDVFHTLTVGTDVTADTTFKEIVIKAAAVQADNCSDAEAAKTALGMLGAVVSTEETN